MDKKSAVQYVANVAVTAWASRGADVVKDMFVFVVCVNDDEQLRVNSTMIVRRFVWLGERHRERRRRRNIISRPTESGHATR